MITKRNACGFHILDHFGDIVAGQVNAGGLEAGRAGTHGGAESIQRGGAKQITVEPFHRFGNFGAVQFGSAIHTTVADQDNIMVHQQPGRWLEVHIGCPRAAVKQEDWLGWLGSLGTDALDWQGDQA